MTTKRLSPGLPRPTVTFTASREEVVVGQTYTLTCYVGVVENLVNPAINVQWLDSSDNEVGNGNGITVGDAMTSGTTTTRDLTFDPLRNDHFGCYTCRGRVTVDEVGVSIPNQIVLPVASDRK